MEQPHALHQPYALFTSIPFIGHLNPLLRQADELVQRGWRVSVAAFEPVRNYIETNFPDITFISLGEPPQSTEAAEECLEKACAEKSWLKSTMMLMDPLENFWPLMFDGLLAEVQRDRPDIMIIDFASTAGLDVAEQEKIPFVINNADLLTVLPATLLPFAPAAPQLFSGHSVHRMGPLQQISAYLSRIAGITIAQLTLNGRINAMRGLRGLKPVDNLRRLKGRTILIDCAFGLEYSRPIPSWMHMVGPMLTEKMEALPESWNNWLNDGPPVIYVSLGTLSSPSADQLKRMSDAFDSDQFRVLWVMRKSVQERLPSELPQNVRVENWIPSPPGVLRHLNVKAFVSHCGVNSVHESIDAGTPIVAIPMFAAQNDMGIRVQDAGVGLLLNKAVFSSEELHSAIKKVIQNQSFNNKITTIQHSFRRAGGIQRAADLIEKEAKIQSVPSLSETTLS